MANTYTSLTYHVVFSTTRREKLLTATVRARLWPYFGGIARDNGMSPIEIGGEIDHAHLLLSIPPTLAVAKAVQLIKGGSSHWIKSTWPELLTFAWQDGYGAFTVSGSQIETLRKYIHGQTEHHRKRTFAEEYRAFLERHSVQFDERDLLD
jgi:putative transposase